MKPKFKQLAGGMILMLFGFGLALLVAEVAIRVAVPKQFWSFHESSLNWQADDRLGWVQRPNLNETHYYENGNSARFLTNAEGIHGNPAPKKLPGTVRILIVGDSTVAGMGVPQNKTVTAQLERVLRARGIQAEVLNAGVEGYSTDQELIRLEMLAPKYRPDIVLYGLCSNDFGANSVSTAFGIAKPRFVVEGSGLKELPPMEKPRIASTKVGWRLWLQPLALYQFLRPKMIQLRATLFGSWYEKNLLGLAPPFYTNPKTFELLDFPLFKAMLARMQKSSRDSGAWFGFYAFADVAEVWDPFIQTVERQMGLRPGDYDRFALENYLKKTAAEVNVPFVPQVASFARQQSRGPFHLLPIDPHNNVAGYEVVAENLADFLTRDPHGPLLAAARTIASPKR